MSPRNKVVVPATPVTPEQSTRDENIMKWKQWAEQQFGGPPERLDICVKAAIDALDSNKSMDEAIVAAQTAAAQWDLALPRPSPVPASPPKQHRAIKAFLVVVTVFLTVMIGGQLARHAGVIGVLALVVVIGAVIALTRLFRRERR